MREPTTSTNGFLQTAGYVVGPSGEQLTEVDGGGNWRHINVYAGGKLIGTYDGDVNAPTLHFHIDDPLGTRRAQTNASGVLEATYQSLPFGDGLNSIPYVTGAEDPTENHFTGKERDTESGNDYFLARYYNSNTSRFLSPDPLALNYASMANPQSLNLYAYVGNNPLIRVDMNGLSGCSLEGVSQTSATCNFIEGAYDRARTVADKADEMIAKGWEEGTNVFKAFANKTKRVAKAHPKTTFVVVSTILAATVISGQEEAVPAEVTAGEAVEAGAAESAGDLLMPGGNAMGQAGSDETIRVMQGGVNEAETLFNKLAQGGTPVPNPTYPGTLVQLPNGGTVGIRTVMTGSPGTAATVDVNIPDIPITKVKFNP